MRSSAVIGLSLWLGDIRVYRVRLIDAVSRIYDIDPQSPVPYDAKSEDLVLDRESAKLAMGQV